MDWPSVVAGAATGPALGGIAYGVRLWLQARAKAIETRANTEAKTREAETTAKVKLIEAEAQMDSATAEAIKGLRDDIQQCKEDKKAVEAMLDAERNWCRGEVAKLNARIDVLYDRGGLTPRDMTKPEAPK